MAAYKASTPTVVNAFTTLVFRDEEAAVKKDYNEKDYESEYEEYRMRY
jgi:hypothetical protein